ncbi:hypothetical protein C8R47DRAFT_1235242 [Mycena vitilis]|nr:hypothetical protein C8R47DRAFT_1235242 [Mycena vitilis]
MEKHEFAPGVTWLAFTVQPATQLPLPAAFLPIWPCTLGPRAPIDPGFEWSFGDCVVDTSNPLVFCPVLSGTCQGPCRILPQGDYERFSELFMHDGDVVTNANILEKKARIREERKAAGVASDSYSTWTSFSASSTSIAVPPGKMFRPVIRISAHVYYDIHLPENNSRELLEEDRKSIIRLSLTRICRLVARFSRLSTERTIRWVLEVKNVDRWPEGQSESAAQCRKVPPRAAGGGTGGGTWLISSVA